MDPVGVVAVVGACRAERQSYAKRLAHQSGRVLVPADRSDGAGLGKVDGLRWLISTDEAVVEFGAAIDAIELVGALTSQEGRTRLMGVVCIVDAVHVFDDLQRDDYVAARSAPGLEVTAAALLVTRQIEYASTVLIVNWETLPTERLSVLIALMSHLNPVARVLLDSSDTDTPPTDTVYTPGQDRPGWIRILNGDFAPGVTDARVSAMHYEHVRPLHPARMERLLHTIESGRFGTVVRSAGFCRLATRPDIVAQWDHVGHMMSLTPLALDNAMDDDEELLAIGQDLGFVGLDLDHEALRTQMDAAVLTDDELAAGPRAWCDFVDPFPPWHTASERSD
ncbi:hypothetical protein BCA37_02535 [Mycobacterium sp. djl-10]|nr:hypothetical protein BCA37_02535 [Mycobacterium sp. djl-10]